MACLGGSCDSNQGDDAGAPGSFSGDLTAQIIDVDPVVDRVD